MYKILNSTAIACAILLGSSGVTFSADDDLSASSNVSSWGGKYIGLSLGYGDGDFGWDFVSQVGGASDRGTLGQNIDGDFDGIIASAHLGYNWQSGRFLVGIEGSFSATNIESSGVNSTFGVMDDVYFTDIDNIASITGRLGFLATDNVLIYGKGGYAGANITTRIVDTFPGDQIGFPDSEWHNGYQYGAGVEIRASENITWGIEYNRYDFNEENHTVNFSLNNPANGSVTDAVEAELDSVVFRISRRF